MSKCEGHFHLSRPSSAALVPRGMAWSARVGRKQRLLLLGPGSRPSLQQAPPHCLILLRYSLPFNRPPMHNSRQARFTLFSPHGGQTSREVTAQRRGDLGGGGLQGPEAERGPLRGGLLQCGSLRSQQLAPGRRGSPAGVSACASKGVGFDSPSKARTWVAGSLTPVRGVCVRQPITVSLTSVLLFLPFPASTLSKS